METVLREQEIRVRRNEACFDRACDEAMRQAVSIFGIDKKGHPHIKGWAQDMCFIRVKFQSYECSTSVIGVLHYYIFLAEAVQGG